MAAAPPLAPPTTETKSEPSHAGDCASLRRAKDGDSNLCTCGAFVATGGRGADGLAWLRGPLSPRPGRAKDGTPIPDARTVHERSSVWCCWDCGWQGYSDDARDGTTIAPSHRCLGQSARSVLRRASLADDLHLQASERLSPRYRLALWREPGDGTYTLQEEYDAPGGERTTRVVMQGEAWDTIQAKLLQEAVDRMTP